MGWGNLGAPADAALPLVELPGGPGRRAQDVLGQDAGRARSRSVWRICSTSCRPDSSHLAAARRDRRRRPPCSSTRESGHAVAVLRREVGAAVERHALRGEEHRHGPAAVARHGLHRLHVDLVHVGPLLAIHLDVDEVLVHERRRCRGSRTTRAPSRDTSGRPSSRRRAAPAGPRGARARRPPRPTGTSPPGCGRAGGGTDWSRGRGDSRSRAVSRAVRPAARRTGAPRPARGRAERRADRHRSARLEVLAADIGRARWSGRARGSARMR